MNKDNPKGGYENRSLMKPKTRGLRAAVASLLLLSVTAWAGGVVTNCTESALREAMVGGGTVTFGCDGFIVLANTVSISLDTVLDASGHTVSIGGAGVRAFHIDASVHFTVVNLTITSGGPQGGSGIWNDGGTLNLIGVRFSGNTAGYGSAIYSSGADANVTATNCYFVGNTATSKSFPLGQTATGGAISCVGRVDLQSCTFVNNRASGRSGDWLSGMGASGESAIGGAICNGGTLTMDLCAFTDNSATGGNGAGTPPASARVSGAWGGEGSGGAIWSSATITVNRCTFCGNSATGGNGGAGGNGDSPQQGTPGDGYPGGGGGNAYGAAIYSPVGSSRLACSTLVSNVAIAGNGGNGGGGGVDSHQDFSGNGGPAGNGGSAVGAVYGGSGTLVNCTVAFNTGSAGAGGNGGGSAWVIVKAGSGGAGANGGMGIGGVAGTDLTNCTVVWNRGTAGSGGTGGYSGGSPGLPACQGPMERMALLGAARRPAACRTH